MNEQEWAEFLEAHQDEIGPGWVDRVWLMSSPHGVSGTLSEQELAELARARRAR